uniref:Major facilitator superfamily (MFS) profile domain-containing protein n=1 Tax=Eutreptiella gymnastica TaxID=73025 RepID=A0A7S1NIR2_9EUGL
MAAVSPRVNRGKEIPAQNRVPTTTRELRPAASDVHVQPADPEDVPVLVAVINEAFMDDAFFKKQAYHDRTNTSDTRARMRNPDTSFLVAKDAQGQVLGAVYVAWNAASQKGLLGQLAVPKASRQRGVGRALVEAAERWCLERNGNKVFDMEVPLVDIRPELFPYFERQGYRAINKMLFPFPEVLSSAHAVSVVNYQKTCSADNVKALRVVTSQVQTPDTRTAEAGTTKPTPVPWRRVISVGYVLFVNHFSTMLCLPFIPFMVSGFFPDLPRSQLGLKMGYLFSSFYFGQFAGAYLWGSAADKYGRRPIMMLGIAGTLVSFVMFGMSTTFQQAIFWRFMWGFLNGNKGVCKVYLGETLDSTNAALGFSIIGIQSAIGRFIGPVLGGLLSNPVRKYSLLAGVPILAQYPYLLPCLIGGLTAALGLLIVYKNLPETLQDESPSDTEAVSAAQVKTERAPFLTTNVALSLLVYGGFSFAHIGFEQLFPLWVLKDVADGGFSFDEGMIGAVASVAGPVQLLSQLTLVPWFATKVSCRAAWHYCLLLMGIGIGIAPVASAFNHLSPVYCWAAASFVYMLVNVPAEAAYTYGAIVVNESVSKQQRGKVNGINSSIAAALRMIGPVFWGTLFAFTATWSARGWALSWQTAFTLISLLLIGVAMLARNFRSEPLAKSKPAPA